jgi:hypothetical protein
MQTIKVFPDYMSSGLWLVEECPDCPWRFRTISVDEDFISYFVPREIIIALNYWHHVWELTDVMSESYWKRWNEDGFKIVMALNRAAILKDVPYKFEYVES